jgi:ferredoxin
MAKITFMPSNVTVDAVDGQKLLVTARKNKIGIRFGCASCRCGTCGIKTTVSGAFYPMLEEEKKLLLRMKLPIDGEVRLACQAKTTATVDSIIDVGFQDTYSPDDGDTEGNL